MPRVGEQGRAGCGLRMEHRLCAREASEAFLGSPICGSPSTHLRTTRARDAIEYWRPRQAWPTANAEATIKRLKMAAEILSGS